MSRDEVIDWAKSRDDQLTSDFNKSRDKVSIDFYPHRIIDKDVVNLKNCSLSYHKAGCIRYSHHARSCRSAYNFPIYHLTVKADFDIFPK